MKYDINITEGEAQLTLPKDRVLEILSDASEDELRVLLAIAASRDSDEAQTLCGLESEEFNSALSYLRGAKLIGRGKRTKKAPQKAEAEKRETAEHIDLSHDKTLPEYSSEDIVRLTQSDRVLGSILDEAQQVFGKVFNSVEMNYILAMRDHLGLDGEYILILLQYFRSEGKPLCYAVRVADELVKKGISDPESLEEYIKRRNTFKGMEGKYRDLFGIGSRALTAYEERYFNTWGTELKLPFELVRVAFERTVEKKGNPQKSYINGILNKWHALGITSVSKLEEYESSQKKAQKDPTARSGEGSFDVNEFFNAALERTYGKKE